MHGTGSAATRSRVPADAAVGDDLYVEEIRPCADGVGPRAGPAPRAACAGLSTTCPDPEAAGDIGQFIIGIAEVVVNELPGPARAARRWDGGLCGPE